MPESEIVENMPDRIRMKWINTNTNPDVVSGLINLFSSKAYHVSRFFVREFDDLLSATLEKEDFNIVQIEGLSMAVYIPTIRRYSHAKISLRAHNAEFQIWERHIAVEKNPLKKTYLKLQVGRLKKFEEKVLRDIDALIPISKPDLETFKSMGYDGSAHISPCGVNLDEYSPCSEVETTADISYIASFDWIPNLQGIMWFIKDVWPLIHSRRPETTLQLAGRKMPSELRKLKEKGIRVLGEVDDVHQFIHSGKIFIVPLMAGSGMRIKILETMAMGKAIVSTSIGAEGMEIHPRRDIVIADDSVKFAARIIELLEYDDQRQAVSNEARKAIENNYDNRDIGAGLLNYYQELEK